MKKDINNPTILITGAKGMLGQEVVRQLKKNRSWRILATDRDSLDITDRPAADNYLGKHRPDFVAHCAAYVEVDKAEDEKALCHKINVAGTENIAQTAGRIGATVIYISTDYVFNGRKQAPYKETDRTAPQGVYARTKLEGEKKVKKYCRNYYILRVAWLFGKAKGKNNFVEKMIDLSKKGPLKVINDQIGSPTSTLIVAEVIDRLIKRQLTANPAKTGVYHLSGKGKTTRFGFTKEIFRQAKLKADLKPVKTTEFFAKAKRPAYSYLDKEKIEKELKIKVWPWKKMLESYLKNK